VIFILKLIKRLKEFIKTFILGFLKIYQKFFTLLGYGSCRYYPTCSQYTKQQFIHNSLFSAFFHSIKRILTCNQLFLGGIDYPIIKKENLRNLRCTSSILTIDSLQHKKQFFSDRKILTWLVPVLEDKESTEEKFYLISNFQ